LQLAQNPLSAFRSARGESTLVGNLFTTRSRDKNHRVLKARKNAAFEKRKVS
jgi:hypothetical protein